MCAMSSSLFAAAPARAGSLSPLATTMTTIPTPTNDMTINEDDQMRPPRAPRMRTIDLPDVLPPFFIRACLSFLANTGSDYSTPSSPASTGLGPIDFAQSLAVALARLSADEASRPATSPATSYLRIVHPLLHPTLAPIYILPSSFPHNGGVVTVYDVLSSIHAYLHSPVEARDLARFSAAARREALLHAQERCLAKGVQKDVVRVIDLLDGATVFAGLMQQEDVARRYVAPGERGIDGWQSVTWILKTVDTPRFASHAQAPTMGLGPYRRQSP